MFSFRGDFGLPEGGHFLVICLFRKGGTLVFAHHYIFWLDSQALGPLVGLDKREKTISEHSALFTREHKATQMVFYDFKLFFGNISGSLLVVGPACPVQTILISSDSSDQPKTPRPNLQAA